MLLSGAKLEVTEFAYRRNGAEGTFMQAILSHPECGLIYIENGVFYNGRVYCWEGGFAALLLPGDTLESLQAGCWGEEANGAPLDGIRRGLDPDRPIIKGLVGSCLAHLAGECGIRHPPD